MIEIIPLPFQGRVVGITVGCLIGMFPLLFMNKEAIMEEEVEKVQ